MFDRVVRYWWLAAVFMIAGGMVGWLVSAISKPVYESTSVITTVIDFAYSGKMTDYEEDFLLSAIGDVIRSDVVIETVVAEGVEAGLAASAEEMRASLTASRQGFRWELSSRLPDAEAAWAANRLWLDAAVGALEQFRQDSFIALAEFNAQVGVESCFAQAVIVEPVSTYCSAADFQALRKQISALESNSLKGSLLTRLLASRISFQVTQEPVQPLEPVHLGRNTAVLAGVLVGLLAAIMLFIFGFPLRRFMDKEK